MRKLGRAFILSTSILIGTATVSMLPVAGAKVEASSIIKFSKTSYQSTVKLNLRLGVGTKYKTILAIPKGAIITSTQKTGTWYKVSYTYKLKGKSVTKTGWVSGAYLKEYYQYKTIKDAYFITTKQAKLYRSPDTKKKQVVTVASNNGFQSTQKIVNSIGQTWYRVTYQKQNLYINSNEGSLASSSTFKQTAFTADKETHLYKSFGTSYDKIEVIPKDTVVISSASIGDWYTITYNGTSGYINIGDFTKDPTATTVSEDPTVPDISNDPIIPNVSEVTIARTTFVTLSKQNLYKQPDESSVLIKTLPKDTMVVASIQTSNDWYQVNDDGKTGYVPISSLQKVNTGNPMNGRTGYQFIDLRTPAPVTAEQINAYIETNYKKFGQMSVLSGKGLAFIKAGTTYGVNALYLAAHAIHESAFGTSEIALGKNNLFGFGSYDASPFIASYRFSSVDENINYIAQQIKATYLNEVSGGYRYQGAILGFKTTDMNNKRIDANSEGMNFFYASDLNWGKAIAKHMQNILPYDQAYYDKAKADKRVLSTPDIPIGSDLFPAGTRAIAKNDLVLNSSKGSQDAVLTLKKGSTFTVLEKTNDYWVNLIYNNTSYWTNSIDFVKYKNYISVQNLGRTKVDSLNVRTDPTIPKDNSDSNVITALNLNDYVQFVLNEDDKITTDSSKKWYQIQLADGTNGWVSADSKYIVRELY